MTNLEVEVETPELMFPPPAILSCILKPIWWDFQGRGEMILTGAPILARVPTDLWCSLWISKLKEEGRDWCWWDIDKLLAEEVLVIGWLAMLDKALMGSIFPDLLVEATELDCCEWTWGWTRAIFFSTGALGGCLKIGFEGVVGKWNVCCIGGGLICEGWIWDCCEEAA